MWQLTHPPALKNTSTLPVNKNLKVAYSARGMLCWERLKTVSEELGWSSESTSEIVGGGTQRWEAGPWFNPLARGEEDREWEGG